MSKVRLNVNLPEQTHTQLKELTDAHGQSMTEFIKYAMGLAAIVYREGSRGSKVMIERPNGDKIEVALPFVMQPVHYHEVIETNVLANEKSQQVKEA